MKVGWDGKEVGGGVESEERGGMARRGRERGR